ncbi:MAG: hypothetical protein UU10_C0023G0008 [Parcubacteria group bacterium GW2011_GWF1_40_6]|uniref:Uncharacterized protein n=1 Tax=Candidatus Nomurabacteria bacterium GW2011_GWF2_40_12 TaxID=1618776 RepID=A0A0G0T7Z4_9BACT|nr:MAG: hypothetical protein UT78_C0007G0033 [Candidatus Nomurabacteria bacterium GW2011_GWF2_40_12]KKR68508.1 MAG: hypothetical protein UU10_C0023G0008 [Parcubacteria group bacterium GW2011_GWF1_40_6]
MHDEDEEVEEEGFKIGDEEELDLPPEGLDDFGLGEEDPDKDR